MLSLATANIAWPAKFPQTWTTYKAPSKQVWEHILGIFAGCSELHMTYRAMNVNQYLHLHNLLVVEGTAIVYHAHAPLGIAGGFCTPLWLLDPPPVVMPPFLMPALLAPEQGNSANKCPQILPAGSGSCHYHRLL